MTVNKATVSTLKAELTIGLNKGYTKESWLISEFKDLLVDAQIQLKQEHGLLLSAKVTECSIVFLAQDEPSVTLSFINYPKFPCTMDAFKTGVQYIAETLMTTLLQNRIVIVFNDETIMLEGNDAIDGSIII